MNWWNMFFQFGSLDKICNHKIHIWMAHFIQGLDGTQFFKTPFWENFDGLFPSWTEETFIILAPSAPPALWPLQPFGPTGPLAPPALWTLQPFELSWLFISWCQFRESFFRVWIISCGGKDYMNSNSTIYVNFHCFLHELMKHVFSIWLFR